MGPTPRLWKVVNCKSPNIIDSTSSKIDLGYIGINIPYPIIHKIALWEFLKITYIKNKNKGTWKAIEKVLSKAIKSINNADKIANKIFLINVYLEYIIKHFNI